MSTAERKARTMRSACASIIVAIAAAGAQGQTQITKLTAADGAAHDRFGFGVSIDGDTAVFGAWGDGDAGLSSGSAYIFREVAGVWQQITKLTANDGAQLDQFGVSVSLSGNTAVVGANWDDDAGDDSGSAYIFSEVSGVWQQIAKLTASDGAAGDQFGRSVSISGDTAIIGADRDDDVSFKGGSAYIFRAVGGVWQQIAKLTAADGAATDRFGANVSISGDTAVVAELGSSGSNRGSVYVFREVGGQWQQIAKLTANDGMVNDLFGASLSLSGDTVVVGALNGDGASTDSGAAYLFRAVGGQWQQIAKLTADDGASFDGFGRSVSLSGSTVVVGTNGDDDAGQNSGSAYLFRAVGGGWQQVAKITSDDLAAGDQFGRSISLSGDTAVITANLDDDAGIDSGSAYVFGVGSACPADLNTDGMLDFFDVSAFLVAFQNQLPIANFNNDGNINFFDLSAFLQAFNAGCP